MRPELLCIITRWEQSGQGEGGRDPQQEGVEEVQQGDDGDDESFFMSQATDDDSLVTRDNIGGLTGRPNRALQSRAAFLNGRPSYVLYFWEIADAHQLLQSSLQRLMLVMRRALQVLAAAMELIDAASSKNKKRILRH